MISAQHFSNVISELQSDFVFLSEKELPVRVIGAIGTSSAGVSGNNATPSVALATVPSTSRRAADQAPQDKHHRHHYHAGHVRRSARSESSPRDSTPSGLVRHHRSTVAGENLAKEMGDHLHLDDEVLVVAVDQPSSPNIATGNHVGEKHCHSHGRSGTLAVDDHARDACSSAAVVAAAAAATGTLAIVCSECRGEGRGVWYRCTVCVDFYLCSDCENRGLHDQHIMVRITSATAGAGSGGSRHGTPNYFHR